MTTYRNEFAFGKITRRAPSNERAVLRAYTGRDMSESDAKVLWQKIIDHKWCVSERLSRDVGFRVAAIDYVENFYEPFELTRSARPLWVYAKAFVKRVARIYLQAKGNAMPI